jgi:co-chaperonin GroES (HSP10)
MSKIKPFGERVLCKLNKAQRKDEDGKGMTDPAGNPLYDLKQEATVIESTVEGIKKGQTIFCVIYGGVRIDSLEDKKATYLIIDKEDIYGVQEK